MTEPTAAVDVDWWRAWARGENSPPVTAPSPAEIEGLARAFLASVHATGRQTFDVRFGAFLVVQGFHPSGPTAFESLASSVWPVVQELAACRDYSAKPHKRLPAP